MPSRTSHADVDLSRDPGASDLPFFYGWVMLPIAMLGVICTSPGQTFGISVFNKAFTDSLGMSLTKLTGAYMVGTFLASLAMPYVGRQMDRHGIRKTMTVVVVMFGLACFWTSQVTGLYTLFLAFLFLRMFGQGALTLLSANTLSYWFNRRLGMVSGIANAGMAGAVAFVPALNLWLIGTVGWRWAYVILGLAVWVILLPLLATLYRDRPEDIGQVPDGFESAPRQDADGKPEVEPDFTVGEAVRTGMFWLMAASTASWSMIGTAVLFNIIPIFESRGLPADQAGVMYTSLGLTQAGTLLIGGFLADMLPLTWLLAAGVGGMIASLGILLWAVGGPWMAVVFGTVLGLSQGLIVVIGNPIWRRYYGRAHLGKIRGSLTTLMVASSSVGPFLVGLAHELLGGYDAILLVFMLVQVPLVVAALIVRPPEFPPKTRQMKSKSAGAPSRATRCAARGVRDTSAGRAQLRA